MEHNSTIRKADNSLLEAIFPIILKNGLKATTMDLVASSLSMSKRTLYETFENKEEMLKEVLGYFHSKHIDKIAKIFDESPTIMEAFYHILKTHQKVMGIASSSFFSDMDSAFAKLRKVYDMQSDVWFDNMLKAIRKGIEQEVFDPEVNYTVLLRMFRVQMESLKRMEEFLPADVTLIEAYDVVLFSFLRSIATTKGLQILDKIRHQNNQILPQL